MQANERKPAAPAPDEGVFSRKRDSVSAEGGPSRENRLGDIRDDGRHTLLAIWDGLRVFCESCFSRKHQPRRQPGRRIRPSSGAKNHAGRRQRLHPAERTLLSSTAPLPCFISCLTVATAWRSAAPPQPRRVRPRRKTPGGLPALIWVVLMGVLAAGEGPVVSISRAEEIVYYDATHLHGLNLQHEAQRRRFWDESHLLFSLQGLVNRGSPRLYIRYLKEPDDFWWQQMTNGGGWLAGRTVRQIASLDELLRVFRQHYRGAVLWDERVPSTSNLASTIAGCEDLLCLRHDTEPDSLCRQLTRGADGLAVRARLLAPDGGPLFTGKGMIPGTTLPSTGSAKADAYHWLIEHYVRPGKTDPRHLGYYLDAFWLKCWRASGPENHTLSNHDFLIARRGALFDLNVWDDEAPVDDPTQQPGTDVAVLKTLLRACYERLNGAGMIHVAGFVPWAYKYTIFRSPAWAAGGTHAEVPTEWRYAEILSCFNAYMDADALGLGAMANASFFQHYPLARHYPQTNKPDRKRLQAQGLLDAGGKITRRHYVAHYVGDYDAAAWLYRQLPRQWTDAARGTTPLSWAFNPNLAVRFPLGLAWARQRATSNDWFVAGDSGAGYLNPGYLTPPRPHSGLPSGLAVWESHCARFYRQWDITLTGFIIDGFARGLSTEGLDAYARFSPDGIVAQKIERQGVHRGMPYVRMRMDLDGDPAEAARTIQGLCGGTAPRFVVCRSILKPPSWYARLESELKTLAGQNIQVVDLYTLLWLVREWETNRLARVPSMFAQRPVVEATPQSSQGLSAIGAGDGTFTVSRWRESACWVVPAARQFRYLYFDVDDDFLSNGGPLEIEVEYRSGGQGRFLLEYDSSDQAAPHGGAYKPHPKVVARGGAESWKTESFQLPDPRLLGRQNHEADFRFCVQGDAWQVRAVRVRRVQTPTR